MKGDETFCHLLPGFTVLDVPQGQGQIRTEPGHKTTQPGQLEPTRVETYQGLGVSI